jgi:hypothetical protein
VHVDRACVAQDGPDGRAGPRAGAEHHLRGPDATGELEQRLADVTPDDEVEGRTGAVGERSKVRRRRCGARRDDVDAVQGAAEPRGPAEQAVVARGAGDPDDDALTVVAHRPSVVPIGSAATCSGAPSQPWSETPRW